MLSYLFVLGQAVPDGRVFGLDQQTAIQIGIQLFNGILLAVVLTYLLYNPVKNFLAQRRQRIEAEFDQAQASQQAAQDLMDEYQEKLAHIDEERQRVLKEARQKAIEDRDLFMEKAQDELDTARQAAAKKLENDRRHLATEMRNQAIDLAASMSQNFLAKEFNKDAHHEYFEREFAQMEDSSWPK